MDRLTIIRRHNERRSKKLASSSSSSGGKSHLENDGTFLTGFIEYGTEDQEKKVASASFKASFFSKDFGERLKNAFNTASVPLLPGTTGNSPPVQPLMAASNSSSKLAYKDRIQAESPGNIKQKAIKETKSTPERDPKQPLKTKVRLPNDCREALEARGTPSLFHMGQLERQEKWLAMKQEKEAIARVHKERDSSKGLSFRPDVAKTKKSWELAKLHAKAEMDRQKLLASERAKRDALKEEHKQERIFKRLEIIKKLAMDQQIQQKAKSKKMKRPSSMSILAHNESTVSDFIYKHDDVLDSSLVGSLIGADSTVESGGMPIPMQTQEDSVSTAKKKKVRKKKKKREAKARTPEPSTEPLHPPKKTNNVPLPPLRSNSAGLVRAMNTARVVVRLEEDRPQGRTGKSNHPREPTRQRPASAQLARMLKQEGTQAGAVAHAAALPSSVRLALERPDIADVEPSPYAALMRRSKEEEATMPSWLTEALKQMEVERQVGSIDERLAASRDRALTEARGAESEQVQVQVQVKRMKRLDEEKRANNKECSVMEEKKKGKEDEGENNREDAEGEEEADGGGNTMTDEAPRRFAAPCSPVRSPVRRPSPSPSATEERARSLEGRQMEAPSRLVLAPDSPGPAARARTAERSGSVFAVSENETATLCPRHEAQLPRESLQSVSEPRTGPPHRAPFSGFFDATSSDEKGRHRSQDPRHFEAASLRRVPHAGTPGVTLLMGRRKDSGEEQALSVLFDRQCFSEEAAYELWHGVKSEYGC